MTRVKILALLVGMVLLFTVPAVVSAQPAVQAFVGTASIDEAAAPEGTTVAAWIGGEEVASTTVTGDGGNYSLQIDPGVGESFAGQTVSFQIGGNDATQTAEWVAGGLDILTLSASSGAEATETSESTATPEEVVVAVAGELGPRGRTGRTGASGPEGPAGAEGPRGGTGLAGSDGAAGGAGPKGDTGPGGSQGAGGNDGSQGPSGAVGRQGDDASSALGFIALILAIIGIAGAGGAFLLKGRS